LKKAASTTDQAQSPDSYSTSDPIGATQAKTTPKKDAPSAPATNSASSTATTPPSNSTSTPAPAPKSYCSQTSTPQASPANSNGLVWVNTDSGVYHEPGTQWYGKTKWANT
jgi:hypothetical protein